MPKLTCKICRRLGASVCGKTKCALIRRSSPPGQSVASRRKNMSEFGLQLREKQKLMHTYGLRETQFRRYVLEAMKSREATGAKLLQELEMRLDSVAYRLGLASSRRQARQLVGHGHLKVNDRRVDIPSYVLKIGDVVSINETKRQKGSFINVAEKLNKYNTPSWLSLDKNKLEGKVVKLPEKKEIGEIADIQKVVEYYSR